LVFEVGSGDRPLGGVGYGLFAEVIEGESPGRGETAAPGLLQDQAHQLQRHLRVRLALLQNFSLEAFSRLYLQSITRGRQYTGDKGSGERPTIW
jgi:hypothetical protein